VTTTSGRPGIQLFDEHCPRAGELLRELHDEILLPSFRPDEYVSPAVLDPQNKLALFACDEEGLVLGGALGEIDPVSGVLLLGYLAIRPGFRGTGIGSVLMAALRERWLGHGEETLAVLEIDDPRHHAAHLDHGDPEARLRFYGGHGVRLLTIPYFQPRISSDQPRGYHMLLGVIPPAGETLPSAAPAGPVLVFLREYFAGEDKDEGRAVHDDAELQRLLDACAGPDIDLVAVEDISRIPDGS
jgi:GNAT superfamily N-acetyltransferase